MKKRATISYTLYDAYRTLTDATK